MQELMWFLGVILALTPLVIALVKAVTDDWDLPRWGKRLLAIFVGVAAAFVVHYVASVYMSVYLPLGIVTIAGMALGLNAAGIYDFANLLGGLNIGTLNSTNGELMPLEVHDAQGTD